jgi:hypothetical protein
MPKFSADEAARIIATSRETISRVDLHSTREARREDQTPLRRDDPPVDHLSPVESRNARHIREINEQEMRFARERVRRKREEEHEHQRRLDAWAKAAAESRVSELESEMADVVRSTATAIEALEHEIARTTGENRELRVRLASLEASLAELRVQQGAGHVTELPVLPLRGSRVN